MKDFFMGKSKVSDAEKLEVDAEESQVETIKEKQVEIEGLKTEIEKLRVESQKKDETIMAEKNLNAELKILANRFKREIEEQKIRTKVEFIKKTNQALSELLLIKDHITDKQTSALLGPALAKFIRTMDEAGIKYSLPQQGEDFSDSLHEIVSLDTETMIPKNKIVRAISPLYMVEGRVVAAAKVIVSAKEDDSRAEDENSDESEVINKTNETPNDTIR